MIDWWQEPVKTELDILIEEFRKHLITKPDLVRCIINIIRQEREKKELI